MFDTAYCYPNTNVLINKLNIKDQRLLQKAETDYTFVRLYHLQHSPIHGNFDYAHLKAIHKYLFQDLYLWAGQERTVEIGKGNSFCTVLCLQNYAKSVFDAYFKQCYNVKDNFEEFIKVFSKNYGDLNALHPFREGNGRTQREFARLLCLKCGYVFSMKHISHQEMIAASRANFDSGDISLFVKLFTRSLTQAPFPE